MTLLALGCTRLNPEYANGAGNTTTLTSTGDTGRITSLGESVSGTTRVSDGATSMGVTSVATSDDPLTTANPTAGPTGTSALDVPKACGAPADDCSDFGPEACPPQEVCRPWGSVGNVEGVACIPQVPDLSVRELGQPCTRGCDEPLLGVSGCSVGAACDPFSDEPTCVALCDGPEACSSQEVCLKYPTAEGSEFGICQLCNPMLTEDNGCQPGQMCVLSGSGLTCLLPGVLPPGSPCRLLSDCMAGFFCASSADPNPTCVPYCIAGSGTCPDGDVCMPAFAGIGICLPP